MVAQNCRGQHLYGQDFTLWSLRSRVFLLPFIDRETHISLSIQEKGTQIWNFLIDEIERIYDTYLFLDVQILFISYWW